MDFLEKKSIALSPNSPGLENSTQRLDDLFLDHHGFSEKTIHEFGARLIDAMKKRGSKKLAKIETERRAAFEKLIKSQLDPSFQIALRLTGNADSAEELVQETMLRAIRNWESFQHRAEFKTWIYRILINAFRDQFRRNTKHESHSNDTDNQPSREHRVDSQAEANELSEIVNHLITQLPDRQKEVLILSTFHSLTNTQIADTLAITVANVHANLSTARKRLKHQLEKYLND